ncbi:MAG: hypothetical protein AVDCRST_MAG34-2017, partial [uncultured Nocardioidaceae bacterium]
WSWQPSDCGSPRSWAGCTCSASCCGRGTPTRGRPRPTCRPPRCSRTGRLPCSVSAAGPSTWATATTSWDGWCWGRSWSSLSAAACCSCAGTRTGGPPVPIPKPSRRGWPSSRSLRRSCTCTGRWPRSRSWQFSWHSSASA